METSIDIASSIIVASRSFSMDDQARFAELTGDVNPLHMDPVTARRTAAGAPVVHGIHLLLWALDEFFKRAPNLSVPSSIVANFTRFLKVDEVVEVKHTQESADSNRLILQSGGSSIAGIRLAGAGILRSAPKRLGTERWQPEVPISHELESVATMKGMVPQRSKREAFDLEFPHAAKKIGATRLAAMGCSTYLVGMVVPGNHSIFAKLAVELCETDDVSGLSFSVRSFDTRLGLCTIDIVGSGLAGVVESVLRPAPVHQMPMSNLAGEISPKEFEGSSALVIGGTRGLGELTAKILASGGGDVTITYARGEEDARRVQAEIKSMGGFCEITELDVERDILSQISELSAPVKSMYYFATPSIFSGGMSKSLSDSRLKHFLLYYVTAFDALVHAVHSKRDGPMTAFYPSSIAVGELSNGMMEYAIAKSAGETLCAYLNKTLPDVNIHMLRLPKLRTDQTNSLVPTGYAHTLETILPAVRAVERPHNAHGPEI